MRTFDADATREALPFDRLIPALARLFAEGCEVPPRQVLEVPDPQGAEPATVLVMPAWVPGRCFGLKTITIAPGNRRRGLPGLHATYLLNDAATGVPLALIDGDELTARRTAAASALAASHLARLDARRLLVVGAGRVAALLAEAHRAVRPIAEVRVWARRPQAAAGLAAALAAQGMPAEPAADLSAAAHWADIVSCATLAAEPVIHGTWLRPGSHLDLIGSFTPRMREADDACFAGAGLWIDTAEALQKSGELLGPMSRGVFGPGDVCGTLAQLCRGERPGRAGPAQRTVFKSVGTALEDLAAGMLVAGHYHAGSSQPVGGGMP
ncbi:ornithine cyclodeaminase family protein [Aquincola sp. MAHUQ-54]|uniref:Ornithine cyclodeaminase family protein n=1 Tax=Aquincola agrisoli TaxID=3119538 RepID=A0AAW9Q5C4_9BURK